MSDRDHSEVLREVARYVDGEMAVAERNEFEARLETDADLAREVRDARELSALFEAERRAPGVRPGEGFAERVVEAARRTPFLTVEPEPDSEVIDLQRWLRRITVAAAILGGVALLIFAGLLREVGGKHIQASPAEVQRVIDELEAKARGQSTGARRPDGK